MIYDETTTTEIINIIIHRSRKLHASFFLWLAVAIETIFLVIKEHTIEIILSHLLCARPLSLY